MKRSSIFAGTLLLLSSVASAQWGMPSVINPATYESPDGVYRLEVDPSDIFGAGAAHYRLTRRGTVLWSEQRPFTLVDAAIDEQGTVAGYAYRGGPTAWGKDGGIHLLILEPTGSARLDQVVSRVMSNVPDAGPEPSVEGLILDPENDRVVFRLSKGFVRETWRVYRLSTGKALSSLEPARPQDYPGVWRWIADAKAVRGTSLILAYWSLENWRGNERGAGFTLIDLAGRTVWSLNLSTRPTALNPVKDKSAIASTTPGSFEIQSSATSELITFTVQQDAARAWKVSEARRRRYVAPPLSARALTGLMDVHRDLKYLGEMRLGASPPGEVSAWTVDAAGRAYIADGRTGTIHVFDQNGRPLRTCKPSRDDVSQVLDVPHVTVAANGALVAQVKEEDRFVEPVAVEFSPDCKGSVRKAVSATTIHANPVTGGLWAAQRHDVAAIDRAGVVTTTIRRGFDGRWLGAVLHTMVGFDGSLAVATSPDLNPNRDVWSLNIFSSNGVPRQQLALPAELDESSFAYDGKRVALWEGGRVRIINLASLSVIALTPTFDVSHVKSLPLQIAARGRELWMLDDVRKVIHRFEMP